jgi:hypothetical protein
MPPSRQIPRRQWYIHVEVAIMEFSGSSHDYFSRVKAAEKNKILGSLPGSSVRCPRIGISPSISWAFRELVRWLGNI